MSTGGIISRAIRCQLAQFKLSVSFKSIAQTEGWGGVLPLPSMDTVPLCPTSLHGQHMMGDIGYSQGSSH